MVLWSVLPHGKYVEQFWGILSNFLCLTDVFNPFLNKLSYHSFIRSFVFSFVHSFNKKINSSKRSSFRDLYNLIVFCTKLLAKFDSSNLLSYMYFVRNYSLTISALFNARKFSSPPVKILPSRQRRRYQLRIATISRGKK